MQVAVWASWLGFKIRRGGNVEFTDLIKHESSQEGKHVSQVLLTAFKNISLDLHV